MLSSNMPLLNFILLIDVTFSTPTGVSAQNPLARVGRTASSGNERGIKLTLIRTVRGGGVIGTRVAFRGGFGPHEGDRTRGNRGQRNPRSGK
jgi:hypothetical protein